MQNCLRCGFEIKSDSQETDCPSCGELVLPIQPKPKSEITDFSVGDDFDFSLDELAAPTQQAPPKSPAPSPQPTPGGDLGEIVDYGNSELSQANDGLLLFDVTLEGIDTNELRVSVREILDDKRFLWDCDSLMNTVKNGRLKISKINSIKASLLIRRLKHLDLQIKWEQYAVMQLVGN